MIGDDDHHQDDDHHHLRTGGLLLAPMAKMDSVGEGDRCHGSWNGAVARVVMGLVVDDGWDWLGGWLRQRGGCQSQQSYSARGSGLVVVGLAGVVVAVKPWLGFVVMMVIGMGWAVVGRQTRPFPGHNLSSG